MSSEPPDDVTLEHWLRGELDDAAAAAIAARLEHDDALAARLASVEERLDLGARMRDALRDAPPDDDVPTVPDHDVLAEIARGGQGVVYRARQRSTGRDVALKVLLHGARTDVERARFEREIDLAASLAHPHVVKVFDRGTTREGHAYVVMELVDGRPIDVAAADRPLDDKLALFDKVCAAVAYAHRNGVIHRDLKPANVLVDREGEPHLLDFGLARVDGAENSELTAPGTFVGTLAFAAPEQLDSDGAEVDARADVHALGVVLYRLLTGAHPFPVDGSVAAVVRHVLETDPPRPSRVAPGVDADLDALVLSCLAKEPDARYATVEALRDDLARWRRGEALAVRAHLRGYVLAKTLRRHRAALVALAVVLVASLTATVVSTRALDDARRQATRATRLNDFLVESIASAMPGDAPRDRTVVEWVEGVADAIDGRFVDEPESEGTLRNAIASVLRASGDYAAAERHARDALAAVEALGDDAAPREALLARRLLAEAVHEQGRLDEAEALLDALADDAARVLPPGDVDRASIVRARAHLLHETQRSDVARRELEASLDALLSAHDARSAEVLSTRHALANVLAPSDPDASLAIWDDLAAIYASDLGPEHGKTLGALTGRAQSLASLGRSDEALDAYATLVDAHARAFGDDNPKTLQTRLYRAGVHLHAGAPGDAIGEYVEVVERASEHLGERADVTLQALQGLGMALRLVGRNADAAEFLARARDGRLASNGADHVATIQLTLELAITARGMRDADAAAAHLADALPRAERVLGRLHEVTTSALFLHALVLAESGRAADAIAPFDDLVARTREVEGDTSWRAWRYVAQRGYAEEAAERFDAAAASYEAAWDGLCATTGAHSPHARHAAERRAGLADRLGEAEIAAVWRDRATPANP